MKKIQDVNSNDFIFLGFDITQPQKHYEVRVVFNL